MEVLLLHYITLHYITLHYITLHYITLHYITLRHPMSLSVFLHVGWSLVGQTLHGQLVVDNITLSLQLPFLLCQAAFKEWLA